MTFEMDEKQVEEIAKTLADQIVEFYRDPRNEKEFKKWLKEKQKG